MAGVSERSSKQRSASFRPGRQAARGFTLIEVQVATLLFVLAVLTLVGHARVYGKLVGWLESEHRARGVVDIERGRAVLTVTEAGRQAGPPACRLRLVSVDYAGTDGAQALVEISDRGG